MFLFKYLAQVTSKKEMKKNRLFPPSVFLKIFLVKAKGSNVMVQFTRIGGSEIFLEKIRQEIPKNTGKQFALLIPEILLQNGMNDIDFFVIQGEKSHPPILKRLRRDKGVFVQ